MPRISRRFARDRMYKIVKFMVGIPIFLGCVFFLFLLIHGGTNSFSNTHVSSLRLPPSNVVTEHTRKIVLVGPPGVGKSTYANILSNKWRIPRIAMSTLLKTAIKEDGDKVIESYMDKGELVPDNIVWKVLEKRLLQRDARNGFIIDGYPRTVKQARTLDSHVRLDAVLELDMPDEALKKIALGRRICKCSTDEATEKIAASKSSLSNDKGGCIDVEECGGIFNVVILKDKKLGIDFPPMLPRRYSHSNAGAVETQSYTECGCNGTLEKRPDDKESVVEDRIRLYRQESPPLLKHYNNKRLLNTFWVKRGVADFDQLERSLSRFMLGVGKKQHDHVVKTHL